MAGSGVGSAFGVKGKSSSSEALALIATIMLV